MWLFLNVNIYNTVEITSVKFLMENFRCQLPNMVTVSKSFTTLLGASQFSQFSCSVLFNSLRPHGQQHAGLPCPSPTPRACSNSCPLSWWCHPTISSSVIPVSSCLQSFPASGSFPVSQFFKSGGPSIGASASASVLPMNIQNWFPLEWTGLILQSKGLPRVFSNTTVQQHQFLWSNSHIHTLLLAKP